MKKKLKIGVISCSIMAQVHMQAVMDNPNTELAMLCDLNETLLHEAADKFGVEKTAVDYRDVLNDPEIDAVIIVTPDQTHKEITLAALAAKKHVLCEKPMALKLDECSEMIAAAKAAETKMMVGQICRYTPGFVEAKKLIDRGEIGELFFVETEYAHDYSKIDLPWRLDPLRHGFLGGGCHAVDLARWIAGDPTEVFAYANHKMLPNYPTDDCTVAIMKFPNNVIGKVFVSTGCKRNYTMRSVFYGTKGTIITDNTSNHMTTPQVSWMNLLTALSMTSPFTPLPLRAQRPSRPALPPSNPAKPACRSKSNMTSERLPARKAPDARILCIRGLSYELIG